MGRTLDCMLAKKDKLLLQTILIHISNYMHQAITYKQNSDLSFFFYLIYTANACIFDIIYSYKQLLILYSIYVAWGRQKHLYVPHISIYSKCNLPPFSPHCQNWIRVTHSLLKGAQREIVFLKSSSYNRISYFFFGGGGELVEIVGISSSGVARRADFLCEDSERE